MGFKKRSRASADEGGDRVTKPQKRRKSEGTRSIAARRIATRSMTRASVHNAVFLTTELLENVLSFLPMKDLLLAQRVSRKWRAVITETKRLQQTLYLLPREPDAYWEYIFAPKDMLLRLTKGEYNRKLETNYVFQSGSLNPLVFRKMMFDDELNMLDRVEDGGTEHFLFRSRPSAKHANASWRRMFLTQPPATGELLTHYGYVKRDLVVHYDPFPGNITIADAMARIETAEAEGDTVEWAGHFLGITGVLFPSDGEANMARIFSAGDDGAGEDTENT